MARSKTSKFAWRSFFAASNSDIWTVIENAIQVASEESSDELRKRRDGFVELMYRLSTSHVLLKLEHATEDAKALKVDQKRDESQQKKNSSTLQSSGEASEEPIKGLETSVDNEVEERTNQDRKPLEKNKPALLETGPSEKETALDSESFLNTEELEAAIEEDSVRIHKILGLRPLLSIKNKDEKELIEAMSGLSKLNVTVEELKATEIGKTVSGLKKHPVKAVQIAAKDLVKSWKDMVDDFQKATEEISKKASENPPGSEGGLQAPPLDAATLASRNTSADLSQLLDDFTAEDLAAGLEKLSSGVSASPRAEDGNLAFLSPVYPGREVPRLDQPELDQSVKERFAEVEEAGLSLGEKKPGEKWHQSEKYAEIQPEKPKRSSPESKEKPIREETVLNRNISTDASEKRKRPLEEENAESAKKARLISDKKREPLPKETSRMLNGSSEKDERTGAQRNAESKRTPDKHGSRTPELKPAPNSPFQSPGKSQPGTSQPAKVPGPVPRARSRTPELPSKVSRPTPSPHSHKPEPQKAHVKPRGGNNFLDFSDAAKRATAPPRRAPEMRDKPSSGLGGPEKRAAGGGVKDNLVEASDDDFELEKKSRKTESRNGLSLEGSSSSEKDGGLAEEDGFLSDSDDESGTLPSNTADKLEETKRRLHEKYMALENAKRSRNTVEIKAGDIPARKKALGTVDKGKARGGLHSKLSKLMRR